MERDRCSVTTERTVWYAFVHNENRRPQAERQLRLIAVDMRHSPDLLVSNKRWRCWPSVRVSNVVSSRRRSYNAKSGSASSCQKTETTQRAANTRRAQDAMRQTATSRHGCSAFSRTLLPSMSCTSRSTSVTKTLPSASAQHELRRHGVQSDLANRVMMERGNRCTRAILSTRVWSRFATTRLNKGRERAEAS